MGMRGWWIAFWFLLMPGLGWGQNYVTWREQEVLLWLVKSYFKDEAIKLDGNVFRFDLHERDVANMRTYGGDTVDWRSLQSMAPYFKDIK